MKFTYYSYNRINKSLFTLTTWRYAYTIGQHFNIKSQFYVFTEALNILYFYDVLNILFKNIAKVKVDFWNRGKHGMKSVAK